MTSPHYRVLILEQKSSTKLIFALSVILKYTKCFSHYHLFTFLLLIKKDHMNTGAYQRLYRQMCQFLMTPSVAIHTNTCQCKHLVVYMHTHKHTLTYVYITQTMYGDTHTHTHTHTLYGKTFKWENFRGFRDFSADCESFCLESFAVYSI